MELWYTETGELVQMGTPGTEEELVIENSPDLINERAQDIIDEFNPAQFLMYHGLFEEEHEKGYAALF